ncbi:MAG TPA: hypothetical protein DEB40_04115 [Elusimicrobia bacterium]|nr:hypothetical protein [Elusimicrobiota bacterium]
MKKTQPSRPKRLEDLPGQAASPSAARDNPDGPRPSQHARRYRTLWAQIAARENADCPSTVKDKEP